MASQQRSHVFNKKELSVDQSDDTDIFEDTWIIDKKWNIFDIIRIHNIPTDLSARSTTV